MTEPLLECIPNFSEGRDEQVIRAIAASITSVAAVKLLEIDSGYDANRTVMTFVGTPEAVCEAAFRAMATAANLIDMRRHRGAHPRIGATDVCPLVPLHHVSMEETVQLAHRLARRVGSELQIPVYCYEYAATSEERRSLPFLRKGEYEGLARRMLHFKPDFGPKTFQPKPGATVIGARKILVAWNCNLATKDIAIAKSIAAEVRTSGRKLPGNSYPEKQFIPGRLPAVRAIGWLMPEYDCVQVSTNLIDIDVTPIHTAYEEISKTALRYGTRVTGSELVGLIPLKAMLEAGRYFFAKDKQPVPNDEGALIAKAVQSMGLDELRPFEPDKKIIEYAMKR
ncbi:glutamate formimidoyltransferase [Rhodoflexus caldus]|uniref:glutamate formimidoyltransferase n=1 Tax=Rhodoflexus caldus TaxID=2891236 RepID=UPI00202A02C4|nr:glutamate formimidoyltransferase [Rhodoflexus caldus]